MDIVVITKMIAGIRRDISSPKYFFELVVNYRSDIRKMTPKIHFYLSFEHGLNYYDWKKYYIFSFLGE